MGCEAPGEGSGILSMDPIKGLMQQKRTFGQLAVEGRQIQDLTDEAGAGPTHELPAFQAGPLIQRRPAWSVHASGRGEEAPRCHLFHSRAEGVLVLVTRCKLPLQG